MTINERKLLSLIDEFKGLGIDQQIDYNKFYLYSLITHSTAIEGSTITEVENQLLFDQGITAKGRSMTEQLMNLDLKSAYEQVIIYAGKNTDISVQMLKKLSSIVMKNTGTTYNTALGNFSSCDGDLRLLNVTAGVGGYSYMNFSKVNTALEKMCQEINQRRKDLDKSDILECYRLSFDVHFQLVTIHPWADGNGRMLRLLMNQLQIEAGVIPSIIHKDFKVDYIKALIQTRQVNDIEIFRQFMFEEHIRNLEKIITDYKYSIERDDVPINVHINVHIKLTERKELIITMMRNNPLVTIVELSSLLGVSQKTINRDINSLKSNNIISRKGANKNGEWVVL